MERKIISVEYEIPGFSQQYCEYSSDQSLLDADIILFRPQNFYSGSGKASFSESGSYDIQRSSEHWRTELLTALEYGKTVFLALGKYQVASIRTGKTEAKGRTVINYVADYDNYNFLPIVLPSMTAKSGTEMTFTGDPVFAIFWKEFKKHLKLKENKDGEYSWTKVAITFGNKFLATIQDIDKALRSESIRTPPPVWVKDPDFISPQETKLLRMIADKDEEIERLKKHQQALYGDLNREQELKNLLFETGKPLESAVTRALQAIGYSAENYDDGELELDQVIISPEGERFIGECEGKDNSAINIDKFRQLSENIQADLQKKEVDKPAVGILFGNGFRLTPPLDRHEQFTEKCLASARRGTILVQAMDLYPVARYILETKDQSYMKLCRDAITASIGRVVEFPDPPKPLSKPAPS